MTTQETTEQAMERIFQENQKAFEGMVMRKAELEILISRANREKRDMEFRIKALQEVLEKHGGEPKVDVTPSH